MLMKIGSKYLVETALMTHGVSTLSTKEILDVWKNDKSTFVWLDKGKVATGTLSDFLKYKIKNKINYRVSSEDYLKAKQNKLTGALTASGTMCACEELNINYAVSAGIGGISHIKEELICPDLYKISSSKVTLVATTFKDMMNRKETFKWLKERNVNIFEKNGNTSTGFMFKLEIIPVDAMYQTNINIWNKKQLLLNEIPINNRFHNINMLEEMIQAGKYAEA